jgi:TetR/AcrR family transcriptional regulator
MPRRPKPARDADASRARIWDAAAGEFAARGFDGAKVDRIAAAARVNKAMIYYHFASKAGLYNAILHDMFAAVEGAMRGVRAGGGTAEAQLCGYVSSIARLAEERPFFPQIWLRELAEGGRHLEPEIGTHFREVLGMLGEILAAGKAAGTMREAHPLLVQLGIVGPVTLFIASRSLRARFAKTSKAPGVDLPVAAVIEHVQSMLLGGLSVEKTMRKRR